MVLFLVNFFEGIRVLRFKQYFFISSIRTKRRRKKQSIEIYGPSNKFSSAAKETYSHSFKLSCDTLHFVRERNIFIPVMVLYWTIHDMHNNEFMAEFEIPSFCHLKHDAQHFFGSLSLPPSDVDGSLELCH